MQKNGKPIIVHHHLIYQARVDNNDLGIESEEKLRDFLYKLLEEVGMACLIPAQLKLSHQLAWTGIVGIITSHIAFHFWTTERYVQLDIYSCKKFDKQKTVKFLDNFWQAANTKVIFIDRQVGHDFKIEQI
jgi:S-adenosylmethionine/arginine decarboxylase-like enzyme